MLGESLKLQPVTSNPLNAETPLSALEETATPVDLFYVRNHFDVPVIDEDQFILHVKGEVAKPVRLTLAQIKGFPEVNLRMVMECAGNGRTSMRPTIKGTPWDLGAISQGVFTGTPLKHILELAGYAKDSNEVKFTGADRGEVRTGDNVPYARSLPLDVALHTDTLVAWALNDQPLTSEHGFPIRLVVPGWYGMASVKWLEEITVLQQPFKGFFQFEEYVYLSEEGVPDHTPDTQMRVRSLILNPLDKAVIDLAPVQVSGIAWTGNGPVTKVEVSFDDGEHWDEAQIESPSSEYGTYHWQYSWRPESTDTYQITARAYDSEGHVQPLKSLWNKGGYGNNKAHQITVDVQD
jgi:sulfite oxidase